MAQRQGKNSVSGHHHYRGWKPLPVPNLEPLLVPVVVHMDLAKRPHRATSAGDARPRVVVSLCGPLAGTRRRFQWDSVGHRQRPLTKGGPVSRDGQEIVQGTFGKSCWTVLALQHPGGVVHFFEEHRRLCKVERAVHRQGCLTTVVR